MVMVMKRKLSVCGSGKELRTTNGSEDQEVSLVTLLVSAIRKSMVSCRFENGDKQDQGLSSASAFRNMEIGWPTNVQHLTHVTFDRFQGFLGLPAEFQVEVPSKVPSARFIFHFLINFFCVFYFLN